MNKSWPFWQLVVFPPCTTLSNYSPPLPMSCPQALEVTHKDLALISVTQVFTPCSLLHSTRHPSVPNVNLRFNGSQTLSSASFTRSALFVICGCGCNDWPNLLWIFMLNTMMKTITMELCISLLSKQPILSNLRGDLLDGMHMISNNTQVGCGIQVMINRY